MFSGIIEAVQPILEVWSDQHATYGAVVRIKVKKPIEFSDIKIGDSIACNGICLTVEKFTDHDMQFCLGLETLEKLELKNQWQVLSKQRLNLERSLRFGDRIHGHLVSGHVEALGKIARTEKVSECLYLDVEVTPSMRSFFWEKGSITLHGVSLTINKISGNVVSVCLIPETLLRTNLADLKLGEAINIEADYFAKSFMHWMDQKSKTLENLK